MSKKIKSVRKKGKKAPSKGKPLSYKRLEKPKRDIRSVRGVFKAWLKAPQYGLMLDAKIKMYVTVDGKLTDNRKMAAKFRHGFDDPQSKRDFWQNVLGVKLITFNV